MRYFINGLCCELSSVSKCAARTSSEDKEGLQDFVSDYFMTRNHWSPVKNALQIPAGQLFSPLNEICGNHRTR